MAAHIFSTRVVLREVQESDLPVFFEQQMDQEATRMAAFPSREREAYMAHWKKVLQGETNIHKTILYDGQVAGNILSFVIAGEREVGYWLGKEYWGKGIATRALTILLEQVKIRPLYAHVAQHNTASRRVLEKCGFTLEGEDQAFSTFEGVNVEGYILKLE